MEQTQTAVWNVRDFDPRSPEFSADPYWFYARLREQAPVHYIPALDAWWITRYHEVLTVVTDDRFGTRMPADLAGAQPAPKLPPEFAKLAELPPHVGQSDPPDHTRVRSLLAKAFTPRVVQRLTPHIEQIARDLLDRVRDRGQCELVSEFAFPLPVTVIAAMLGVPMADQEQFRTWSARVIHASDRTAPPEVRQLGLKTVVEMAEYFEHLIAQRREHPTEDLISAMIAAEEEGRRLSAGEIVNNAMLLLIAGHESTTNLISTGLLALLEHPDQLALLRREPDRLPVAVEELLRYVSPAQRFPRVAQAEVELAGVTIPRGAKLEVVFAAANRDPVVFTDPDRLDITRNPNPHVAFGRGIHFCFGAPLARTEALVAFRALLERLPNPTVADPGPIWNPGTFNRGLKSLPLRL